MNEDESKRKMGIILDYFAKELLKHQVNVFPISSCCDLNAQDVVILQNLRHYVFLIKVFACLRHCQTDVVGGVVTMQAGNTSQI